MGIDFSLPSEYWGFHVVTHGTAYLWQGAQKEPIILHKGDIAFMSRGMNHHITTHNDAGLIDKNATIPTLPKKHEAEKNILTLVSGAYQLWNNPIHPLFFYHLGLIPRSFASLLKTMFCKAFLKAS